MVDEHDKIESLAARLREAERNRTAIAPLRNELPDADVRVGYQIQECNTGHWLTTGRKPIGFKIGLTSQAVQQQLKVDQPDCGILYADMAVLDDEPVDRGRLIQPRAEAELAFVVGKDINPGGPATVVDLMNAIDCVMPAIEICDSRIENWNIGILDTVADNASSGLFVLGTSRRGIRDFDLRLCGMMLEKNGEALSFGAGAACLGHPLHAVLWLARTMGSAGRPLKAGDIVLSGALGPMIPAAAGDRFEARISGLGGVQTRFV